MFKHLLIVGCLADQQHNKSTFACMRKSRYTNRNFGTICLPRSEFDQKAALKAPLSTLEPIYGDFCDFLFFLSISAIFGRFWLILTFRLVGPPAGSLNVDQQFSIVDQRMLWLPSTLQVLNICCLLIASLTLESIG